MVIFIFGGGGGGGGLITDDPGEDVEETIAPDEILYSLTSVLYTIAAACIFNKVNTQSLFDSCQFTKMENNRKFGRKHNWITSTSSQT